MDGGFFKGTTTEQDSRFSDKQSKLMRQMKFSDILENKIDMSKVDLKTIKPWINKRLTELLGFDDDVVVAYVSNQLETKHPNPKEIQVNLTGFLNAKNSRLFLAELWELLISASLTDKGVPLNMIEAQLTELKNYEDDEMKIKSQLDDETAKYAKLLKIEPTTDTKERESRKRDHEQLDRKNNSPRNNNGDRLRRRSNEKRHSPPRRSNERKRSGSRTNERKHSGGRRSNERNEIKTSRNGRSNEKKRSGSRKSIDKKRSNERHPTERRSLDRGSHKRRENSRERHTIKKENRSPVDRENNIRIGQEKLDEHKKKSAEREENNILNLDYKDNSEEISKETIKESDRRKKVDKDHRCDDKYRRSRSVEDKRDSRRKDRERSRKERSRSNRPKESLKKADKYNENEYSRQSRRENHNRTELNRKPKDSPYNRNHTDRRNRRDMSEERSVWKPEIVKETWKNKSDSPEEKLKKEIVNKSKRRRISEESPSHKKRSTKENLISNRKKRYNSSNSSEEILKKYKIGSMYADRMNEDKSRSRKDIVKTKEPRPEAKSYRRDRRNTSEDRVLGEKLRDRNDRMEREDLRKKEWNYRSRSPDNLIKAEKAMKERISERNKKSFKRSMSSSSSSSSSSNSSGTSSSDSSSSSSDSSSSSSSSSDESVRRQVRKRKSSDRELIKEKVRDDSFLKEEEKRLRQKALESLKRRK